MDYLTVHWLSLLHGFIFVSVFFPFFSFLNRFPLQLFLVPYSYLLLSTPLLVYFLVNQPHYHRFLVFHFHKLLLRMHYTNWQFLSFLVQSLDYVISYRMISSAQ